VEGGSKWWVNRRVGHPIFDLFHSRNASRGNEHRLPFILGIDGCNAISMPFSEQLRFTVIRNECQTDHQSSRDTSTVPSRKWLKFRVV
jgi:hypothetical protein